MSDNALTFMIGCDVCGDAFPVTETVSVPWHNLEACSMDCKQQWVNQMNRTSK